MGNKNQPPKPLTDQIIKQSVKVIINDRAMEFKQENIREPISILMRHFKMQNIFQTKQQKFKANKVLLSLIFDPLFTRQVLKILKLITDRLTQWNKKSVSSVKVKQFESMFLVANFLLLLSNEKILGLVDSLLVRSDLQKQTYQYIEQLKKNDDPPEICVNLVQRMSYQQKQDNQKLLRLVLVGIINMRSETFARSDTTLQYIAILEQSLFMLYTKIYFSKDQENLNSSMKQHFKSNLTIGGYFLAAGSSRIKASLYQAAVLFIYSIFKHNKKQVVQLRALPSHLFKNLPVVTSKSLYDYIICNALFSMKYIRQGNGIYTRFVFNRIMTLKMLIQIFKNHQTNNTLIVYYLQELCLQVKAGQIERAFISELLRLYIQKNQNKSELLKKFLLANNLKYNLKFQTKQIRVSSDQIMTELEDDDNSVLKQFELYSQKFIYECVLNKNIVYHYNDRMIWNNILPGIMVNKEDEEVKRKFKNEDDDDQEQIQEVNKQNKGQIEKIKKNQQKKEKQQIKEKIKNQQKQQIKKEIQNVRNQQVKKKISIEEEIQIMEKNQNKQKNQKQKIQNKEQQQIEVKQQNEQKLQNKQNQQNEEKQKNQKEIQNEKKQQNEQKKKQYVQSNIYIDAPQEQISQLAQEIKNHEQKIISQQS